MSIDLVKLEREMRDEKATAHQLKLAAQDRGEQRAATFEAGRVAGLALALRLLELAGQETAWARSA
jgi:hypothetical protein